MNHHLRKFHGRSIVNRLLSPQYCLLLMLQILMQFQRQGIIIPRRYDSVRQQRQQQLLMRHGTLAVFLSLRITRRTFARVLTSQLLLIIRIRLNKSHQESTIETAATNRTASRPRNAREARKPSDS